MKQITENELHKATSLLKEYVKVVEASMLPSPPPIGVSGTPSTGSTGKETPQLKTDISTNKTYQDAINQLQAEYNRTSDPKIKNQLDALTKVIAEPKNTQKSTDTINQPVAAPKSAPVAAKQTRPGNEFVRSMQQDLNKKLGIQLALDGKMGPKTLDAMAQAPEIAASYGLSPTGTKVERNTVSNSQSAQPTTTKPTTPRTSSVDQALGSFAPVSENVSYREEPTIARIIGLAGLR